MKNLLKYCLILFVIFGISSSCFAGSLFEGFRGIKWGTNISYFINDFQYITYDGVTSLIQKKDENLTLGSAELDDIYYYINVNSKKFVGVYLSFERSEKNIKEIYNIILKAIGQKETSHSKNNKVYKWDIPPLLVTLMRNRLTINYKKVGKKA